MAYVSEEFFGIADITGAYFAGLMLCSMKIESYVCLLYTSQEVLEQREHAKDFVSITLTDEEEPYMPKEQLELCLLYTSKYLDQAVKAPEINTCFRLVKNRKLGSSC